MFDLTKRATERPFASPNAARELGALARRLADAVVLPWLIIASVLAVFSVSAATIVGWRITGELPDPDRAGVAINAIALGVALLISFGTGLLLPAWWRRIACAAALLPALLLTVTSGNTRAALTALAVIAPATWLGRSCAARLLGPTDRLTAWLVGSTLGFGLVAGFGFLLGTFGILRPAVIWPTLIATTAALVLTERDRLRDDTAQFAAWLRRPVQGDRLTLLLVGIGLALVWYNTIGALSPETASDTVRVRLPTTSYFAQTRHLAADNPELLNIIQTPATGEIANAVLASIGPLQVVKVVVFLQGIACALAIFVLGRHLHTNGSGLLAAFIFYSMPLVSWLSQTAYHDLLLSLLSSVAALVIVTRALPDWRAAVTVGILAGLGVGVKLHFGYVALGLAVVFGVRCLWDRHFWATLRLGAIVTMTAALTAAPWLIRSAILSGQIPGLALASSSLTRASDEKPVVMSDLPNFGYGRSLGHLLRSLLDMTISSTQFDFPPTRYGPFGGLIGFILLGLLPLALIVFPARRRLALALLAGGVTAFLLWFYTAQYLRYSVPVLALLCPLAGTVYGVAHNRAGRSTLRTGANLALLVSIICGVVLQLQVPALGRAYVLGYEDARQYLDRNAACCARYHVIQLLNAEPGVTRVFSALDMARLYTAVRISTPGDSGSAPGAASDEASLFRALDEGGYSHIVVARNWRGSGWEAGPLADESVLRRNTVLIGGQRNIYLYRILPPEQRGMGRAWTTGYELIPDGNAQGDLTAGRIAETESRSTNVPVTPWASYLLTHQTRTDSNSEPGVVTGSLTWRDAAGRTLATTREDVPTSPLGFHQFSTLGVAPTNAATVEVRITAKEGAVWFGDLSLRALATGVARP